MRIESVINTSRQKAVNRAFVVVVVIALAMGALARFGLTLSLGLDFSMMFWTVPFGVFLIGLVFGALSKRAIDYVPGPWKTRRAFVSVDEFKEMYERHEEAYGYLYSDSSYCCCCFFELVVVGFLVALSILLLGNSTPVFNTLIDSVLLFSFIVIVTSVMGFITGYKMVNIDPKKSIPKPSVDHDILDFLSALARVPGVRAGFDVQIGERAGLLALMEAEPKAYIEGLPDTVQLKLQISRSGFVYPYIVATYYKGPTVEEHKERQRLGTKYPAIFEYMMDKDVTVIVGRFDIPKRTSSVPHISDRDFYVLAVAVVSRMRELAAQAPS
ncbi:MAG: hypothetical protein ACTSYX_08205 [Candidatus Thorarchaeota archaeon]